MTKSDIMKRVAAEVFISTLGAGTAVDIVFSEIGKALARGERVTIRGFGTFATTSRAERIGRNPGTGKRIEIPVSKSVSFKASKALKDAVN